jgi:hypothetical protein
MATKQRGYMSTVITKKTVSQIQAGDVVGLIGQWLNYTDEHDERRVTVLSVEKTDLWNCYHTHVMGKCYLIACSDGNTYEITSSARKYFIFDGQVVS